MLFNSLHFLIFFPIVYLLFWTLGAKSVKVQNVLVLLASYYFYASWDWRFLSLLIIITAVNYFAGLKIEESENLKRKKQILAISITFNLVCLGFFKYFNFFISSWVSLFNIFGYHMDAGTLNIILPIGISFYTFHTMSYTIDVYRGMIKPTKKILDFSCFVAFFPQLVAGPISRARDVLPQFSEARIFNFEEAMNGFVLIFWGLFKKLVVADNAGIYVSHILRAPHLYSSSNIIIVIFLYAFQIYGDFSGYSDIAIGASLLMGIRLMQNFRQPYFSKSLSEFWNRWHISLSSWFYDYLFNAIVIAKRDWGKAAIVFGLMVTFLTSGLWHGANWTFVGWGFIHGAGLTLFFITAGIRKKIGKFMPKVVNHAIGIAFTFSYVCFSYIFFRSPSWDIIMQIFHAIGRMSFRPFAVEFFTLGKIIVYISLLIIADIFIYFEIHKKVLKTVFAKVLVIILLIMSIVIVGSFQGNQFIYFNF